MTDNILAPNARWQGRDQTGQPIVNGKLYTYTNMTVVPKATYQDYQGFQPNLNPVILDGKGEANIYWAVDDLYTIKLFTEDDDEVYTQDNYPIVGSNTVRILQESEVNIVRNEQFYFWDNGSSFSPVAGTGSQSNTDFICNDWLYSRVGTAYTVNITRQAFTLDQTDVPNNPKYFFRYNAATTPAGETNNRLYQRYSSVLTFAGDDVTVSLYAKSSTSSQINVYLTQDFGSGGSPSASVRTLVFQQNLTSEWARYNGTITLPTLLGKTLGTTANSDALVLEINFPNDVVATIDLCNVQIQQGDQLTPFPYETKDDQYHELNDSSAYGIFTTGDIKATIKTVADAGWLMMADQTIGNIGSGATSIGIGLKALYTLLWNNVADAYAPVSTGRGASAEADWNALKTITLLRTMGRALGGAGAGSGLTSRALGQFLGTETHTLTIAEMPAHNHPESSQVTTGHNPNTAPTNFITATDFNTGNSTPLTIASQGGGAAHTIMQPTTFFNYMIKL